MSMKTQSGGIGKMFGKAISGESMFENVYTANGNGMIAFTTGVPGRILAIELAGGKTIIAQKRSFLASDVSVEMSTAFQKKVGAGLVGGEGFIMQKFAGNGNVFLEIDGSTIEYELQPGQTLIVDTGSLAAMEGTVQMDVVSAGEKVLVGKYSGSKVKLGENEYTIVRQSDILAVVE